MYTPEQQERYRQEGERVKQLNQEMKQKLNLGVVLQQHYGYTLWEDDINHRNDRKSTKTCKVFFKRMHLPGTRELVTEVLLVYRNTHSSEYYYMNPQDRLRDRGNIFDLVRNKTGLVETKEVGLEVTRLYNSYGSQDFHHLQVDFSKADSDSVRAVKHFKTEPLTDLSYFHKRGINTDTVLSREFDGRFFNTSFYIDNETGTKYLKNVAVPYFNPESTTPVAVEVKNIGLAKYLVGSAPGDAWFCSNHRSGTPVQNLIIGENAFDMVAFKQLSDQGHQQLEKYKAMNNLYFASGGPISATKVSVLQKAVLKQQPKHIVFATDRENAGLRYDFNLLGQLNFDYQYDALAKANPEKDYQVARNLALTHRLVNNSRVAEVRITLPQLPDEKDKHYFNNIKEKLSGFNKRYDSEIYTFSQGVSNGNNSFIDIRFHNSYDNNLRVFNEFKASKMCETFLSVEKPRGFDKKGELIKDFNDLLMNEKGIDKSEVSRKSEVLNYRDLPNEVLLEKLDAAERLIDRDSKQNKQEQQRLEVAAQDVNEVENLAKAEHRKITFPDLPVDFEAFKKHLVKEESEILIGSFSKQVEQEFKKWKYQNIEDYKAMLETKNLELKPAELKELENLKGGLKNDFDKGPEQAPGKIQSVIAAEKDKTNFLNEQDQSFDEGLQLRR